MKYNFKFKNLSGSNMRKPFAVVAIAALIISGATPFVATAAAGSVKTVDGGCGSPVNVNEYAIGDEVLLKGSNFNANTQYNWSITGKPGNASEDPGVVVASGTYVTDGTGAFCFSTGYFVQPDDGGVYGYNFGGKKDNYHVGEEAEEDPETGNLTLVKVVEGGQGQGSAGLWTLSAEGDETDLSGTTPVSGEVNVGNYDLSESGPDGYTASNWVCMVDMVDTVDLPAQMADVDTVVVGDGQNITCTITNTFDDNEDPEVPNLHFIKVVCDDYSDIVGNPSPETLDDTEGNYTQFQAGSVTKPVAPAEIPGDETGCARADGWSFQLSTDVENGYQDQVGDLQIVGPTTGGEYVTPVTGEDSDLNEALQSGIQNGSFWVSEVEQEGFGFATIRCYNDALNGDNLEFINLGEISENTPSDIYCIAYNVDLEPDVDPCDLEQEVPTKDVFTAVIDFLQEIVIPQPDCDSTISGMKYNDLNNSGTKDLGEPGLEGWDIYAYSGAVASNVTVDSADITGTDTNAVAAGTYLVMARGTWNNGGSQYFDTEFHTTNTWSSHEDGAAPYGTDIGDIVINDTNFVDWGVYNDQNENGFAHYYFYILNHPGGNINYSVFDGEAGVKNAGWYGDNTGSINIQMYPLLDTDVTDADGNYTLEFDTEEGVTVVVREVQQNGWTQTSPNSSTGTYALNGLIEGVNYPITGNWNFIFEPGNRDVTGADFGNHFVGEDEEESCHQIIREVSLALVSPEIDEYPQYNQCAISGYKYSDFDGDGNVDEEDGGLSGWKIYIDENDNNQWDPEEQYDITDSNGYYSFTNLAAGTYVIREENQSGWNTIFPSTSDEANEYVINLVLESFNGTDFHNQPEDEPCEEQESQEVSLISTSDTDTAGYTTTTLSTDADGLNALNYSNGGLFTDSVATTYIGAWIDPTTTSPFAGTGAVWISTDLEHPGQVGGQGEGSDNQWRLFQTKFTVPADATVTPGTLNFTADNAVSVYLNGVLIDDTSEDLVTYGPNSPIPAVFVNTYSVALNPVAGQENVLEFVVRNSAIGQSENPTGLLYSGDFSYSVACDDGGDGGDGGDGDDDDGDDSSSGSSSNRTGRVLGDSTSVTPTPQILGAATQLPRTGNSLELYTLLAFMAILVATPLLSRKSA